MKHQDKITAIEELHLSKGEQKYASEYLLALNGDVENVISEYETWGSNPRQIIMNKWSYERACIYGFTEKTFDEHGWLTRPDFLNKQIISFYKNKSFLFTKTNLKK